MWMKYICLDKVSPKIVWSNRNQPSFAWNFFSKVEYQIAKITKGASSKISFCFTIQSLRCGFQCRSMVPVILEKYQTRWAIAHLDEVSPTPAIWSFCPFALSTIISPQSDYWQPTMLTKDVSKSLLATLHA